MCVTINWPGAVPNSQEQGRRRERGSFHFYEKVKVVLSDSVIAEQSRAGKREGKLQNPDVEQSGFA